MKISSLILWLCSENDRSWVSKNSVRSLGWDLLFSNPKIWLTSENMVVSPLSVLSAMYMLAAGTEGESQKEILVALKAEGNRNVFKEYASFVDLLVNDNESEYTLQLANAAFYQEQFRDSMHPFAESLSDNFIRNVGNIQPVDFAGQSEEATEKINNWVSNITRGKIDKIFDGTLDSTTMIVLANALYYKADWKHKFLTEISSQYWRNHDGRHRDVEFMNVSGDFLHHIVGGDIKLNVVEIPMVGKRHSHFNMAIWYMEGDEILGETDEDIQRTILENFETYRSYMKKTNARLMMPKISIGSSYNLVDQLRELGIKAVFDGHADFSPIFGQEVDAYVGKINHKVQLDIDENGIEGAAATAILISSFGITPKRITPKRIDITSPFYFSISLQCFGRGECHGKVPIFVGKVVKPYNDYSLLSKS